MSSSWNIRQLIDWTTRYFNDMGIEEPRLEAEILLSHVLQRNRVYLYTNHEEPVNQHERTCYREYIKEGLKVSL